MQAIHGRRPERTGARLTLPILLGVVFLNLVGFGVVIPLLPFFAGSFGAEPWQITLLFSAYSLGNVFGEPFWGRLSDRIGRRPVLLLTIAGNALTYIALAFAPSLWAACAIRLCGGFLTGNVSTIQGYIADVSPPERRPARLGLLGAAFGIGFLIGPVLGGLAAMPGMGMMGYRLPLLAASGFCALSALGVALFVRESRVRQASAEAPMGRFADLRRGLGDPVLRRVFAITFLATAGFSAMESVFGLWTMSAFSWGPREISGAFIVVGLAAGAGHALLIGPVARRVGQSGMLLAGLVLVVLGLAAMSLVAHVPPALAAAGAVAFGQALALPNLAALVAQAAGPARAGAMLGLNLAAGAVARVLGPLLAGGLFSMISPSAPFVAAVLIVAPAIWLAISLRSAQSRAVDGDPSLAE
jgi:MFS family permease